MPFFVVRLESQRGHVGSGGVGLWVVRGIERLRKNGMGYEGWHMRQPRTEICPLQIPQGVSDKRVGSIRAVSGIGG